MSKFPHLSGMHEKTPTTKNLPIVYSKYTKKHSGTIIFIICYNIKFIKKIICMQIMYLHTDYSYNIIYCKSIITSSGRL